jgi:hypothetical protein
MNELEEILELLGEEQLEELKGELFLLISNCVASQHFQVCFMGESIPGRAVSNLLDLIALSWGALDTGHDGSSPVTQHARGDALAFSKPNEP